MTGENFQIYSVQITGKCICEAFSPFCMFRSLGPSPCKISPINLFKKDFTPMQLHFREKVPPYCVCVCVRVCVCVCVWGGERGGVGGGEIMTLTLAKCNFSTKPPGHCAFNVVQHGYQTFQTV